MKYKKMNVNIIVFMILSLFLLPKQIHAQYSNRKIKSKHQVYTDSLKQVEYNYTFPILGQGAYRKGFDIPYPVGIMGNYMDETRYYNR